eukprot:TRINITY_DN3034_c0_g2_i5.p1 TRINITY_DN3034_c0_g2~~TRINITY_DN3034_c0_g2_i5.p1  ORF type:complete len:137 (-),score=57.07 TRINITY_DN3034_c0_g2_i5:82-492(-)
MCIRDSINAEYMGETRAREVEVLAARVESLGGELTTLREAAAVARAQENALRNELTAVSSERSLFKEILRAAKDEEKAQRTRANEFEARVRKLEKEKEALEEDRRRENRTRQERGERLRVFEDIQDMIQAHRRHHS